MDGTFPPDCPYTDTVERTATVVTDGGELNISVEERRTHWSDVDIANVGASLSLSLPSRAIHVSSSGDGATRTSVRMSRPVQAGSIDLVADAFGLGAG
jgi:hypothetical protein